LINIQTARIDLSFPSANFARTVYQSLKPELNSQVHMSVNDDLIIVTFEADSTAKLQALTNSYLRWIAMIVNVLTDACSSNVE
jgi:tRNA threonylcarbamoyladenosine modification (KEOPS) complex  Pcc1 subunit